MYAQYTYTHNMHIQYVNAHIYEHTYLFQYMDTYIQYVYIQYIYSQYVHIYKDTHVPV